MARTAARHPRVTISVGILDTEEIPHAVSSGEAHLGLAFEVRRRAELRLIASARFRLGAVVLPGSALANLPSLTLSALRDHNLVLPKANFANRSQLDQAMTRARIVPRGRYQAGSIDLMKQLVLQGLGAGVMTTVGLEAEIADGQLVHVPLRMGAGYLESELGLYARADTPLPLAAEMFAHNVATVLAEAITLHPADAPEGPQ
jgi:DNA-binding transcriptional LysR family regulator